MSGFNSVKSLIVLGFALALSPQLAWSACVVPAAAMKADDISRYTAAPDLLFGAADEGGGAAASRIRNLVASDPASLAPLDKMIKTAAGDQAMAVGLGLGSAAQICVRQDPAAAAAIQKAVLEANNTDVAKAFATIVGDRAVEAVSVPSAPVDGFATPGGGNHRGTDPLNYGFRSGALLNGSTGGVGSPGSRGNSTQAQLSVSGFR